MNFEDILVKPGTFIDKNTPEAKSIQYSLGRFISHTIKKLYEVSNNKSMDFKIEDFSLHKNEQFPGAMVVSMTLGQRVMTDLEHIARNSRDYIVCLKSDGVRYLLAILNNGMMVFIDRNFNMFEVKTNITGDLFVELKYDKIEIVHLFDGELIMGLGGPYKFHFQLFDVLVYSRSSVITYDYIKRLTICQEFIDEYTYMSSFYKHSKGKDGFQNGVKPKDMELLVIGKDFYKVKDTPFVLGSLAKTSLYNEKIDGLIFTKINYPYVPGKNKGILKWKPDYLNSIDFMAKENKELVEEYCPELSESNFHVFELYVITNNNFQLFDYFFVTDENQYRSIMDSMHEAVIFDKKINGVILELNYHKEYEDETSSTFFKKIYDVDLDRIRELIKKSKIGADLAYDNTTCYTLLKTLDKRFDIVEDTVKGNWNLLRVRADKALPNGYNTARRVLLSIFEEYISENLLINTLKQQTDK